MLIIIFVNLIDESYGNYVIFLSSLL